jgi:hypothetical protein
VDAEGVSAGGGWRRGRLEEGEVGGGGGWRRGWLEEGEVGGGGGVERRVLSDEFIDHLSTERRH